MTGGGSPLPVVRGSRPPGPSPAFQRVAIIGLGAIGGSLAMALRRAWPDALVIGVDSSAVLETAMRMHAIDVGSDDLMIASDADLVVLAGNPTENARVLPFLADHVGGEAVVVSLGSVSAVSGSGDVLPARLPLVVALPAVELRRGGIEAAGADLFRGRRWAVTPVTAPDTALERVRELIRAVGGDPDSPTPG